MKVNIGKNYIQIARGRLVCFPNVSIVKFLAFLLCALVFYSQMSSANEDIPIWPGANSGKNKVVDFSKNSTVPNRAITRVSSPNFIYVPPKVHNNHTAILIVPGGGFSYIMKDLEGLRVADYLSQRGYSSFVLIYRMPKGGSDENRNNAFSDVQRSLRKIRSMSVNNEISINKVGVMGFSAGAYLAANVSNKPNENYGHNNDAIDRLSARPDFTALIYPVISMKTGITHQGTRQALYGKSTSQQIGNEFSQENLVSKQTPPTFIAQALDDKVASPQNSLLMFDALRKMRVNVELHLFHEGGHGFSTGAGKTTPVSDWLDLFCKWQQSIDNAT